MVSRFDSLIRHAQHQLDVNESSFVPYALFNILAKRGYVGLGDLIDLFDEYLRYFGMYVLNLKDTLNALSS